MDNYNIEMLAPSELKEYHNNPRNNDEAVEYVANSIKEFGFKIPIVVDKDNTIIAGHTRKLAALELGLTKVPVIRADDLTDEQAQAFRLADNKVAEISTWNDEMLQHELIGLEDNYDLSNFGFDELPAIDMDDYNEDITGDEYEEESEENEENFEDYEESTRGYSITYEIAFNNEDEQERWYDFLGTLRKEYPDVDTIAERILLAVEAWKSGK